MTSQPGARTRKRSTPKPARQRRPRAKTAPTSQRGWQHHKARGRTAQQKLRHGARQAGTHSKRLMRKRGAIFGVLSLAVAITAFALVTVDAVTTLAAWELGVAGEGLSFGVAMIIGEKPEQPGAVGRKAKQAAAYIRGHDCGAPTTDQTPCKKRVRHGVAHCHLHGGGGGSAKSKPKTATAKSRPKPAASRPLVQKQAAGQKP